MPERRELKKRCMKTHRRTGQAESQRRARRVEQRIDTIRSAKRIFKVVQANVQGVGQVGEPECIGRPEINALARIDCWQDRQGLAELCPVQAVEQLKFCEPRPRRLHRASPCRTRRISSPLSDRNRTAHLPRQRFGHWPGVIISWRAHSRTRRRLRPTLPGKRRNRWSRAAHTGKGCAGPRA